MPGLRNESPLRDLLPSTRQFPIRRGGWAVFLALTLVSCASEPGPKTSDIAYVRSAETPLFDQLGPSSQMIDSLKAGQQIEIQQKRPRWVQVRTAKGRSGWIQEQRLVSQQVFDQFQRLASESKSLPAQGAVRMRREANLHLEPRRDSETFYQLAEGEEAEALEHRAVEKSPAYPNDSSASYQSGEGESGASLTVEEAEDWFLIRATEGRAGWVLESAFDMNVPIEVAQYREGLRIRAWFILRQEQGGERPWYLWTTIRRVAGLPYDFDEIRVFVWNPAKSRYETAYRERNLIGFYPIEIGKQETPSGPAPTFRLQLEDPTGKRFWKNYILVGRQVRPES
ncbi:MAG: hypothetical protein HY313_04850 [Acidobacteria bacterium]|nr:hypothetical protein [Acidobacteriota bacterium]